MSQINVPPVTGRTPAQIAQELRVLIRDYIWGGLKGAQTGNPQIANHREAFTRGYREVDRFIDKLDNELERLNVTAKRRRPSETKEAIATIRSHLLPGLRSNLHTEKIYGEWAFAQLESPGSQGKSNSTLLKHTERAYALVQALPIIENSATGKAENTLRAITAMIKVYHGLDIQQTAEGLPNVMKVLLAEAAKAKKKEEAEKEAEEMIAAAKADEPSPPAPDQQPVAALVDPANQTGDPLKQMYGPVIKTVTTANASTNLPF